MKELTRASFMRDFVSLCYHYVRPKHGDPFPRLLGTKVDDFVSQIRILKAKFQCVALDEIESTDYQNFITPNCGLLFTFDDGLSDHLLAAEIMANEGLRGVFFIPTCILVDDLPANPMVIHYSTAMFGIDGFLKSYRSALEDIKLSLDKYDVSFIQGESNPWETLGLIKKRIKYDLNHSDARMVLMHVYRHLLLVADPNILRKMHIDKEGVRNLINMGHSIGTHSHTHISIAAKNLSDKDFYTEIVRPRQYLEDTFKVPVTSISYPFGGHLDCFSEAELKPEETGYRYAFTVEKKLNTQSNSRYSIGRYMPLATDNAESIENMLSMMIAKKDL
jgi:peptidoglycan/xylan/chitin deacetylase (PgdA/CDA1 family)